MADLLHTASAPESVTAGILRFAAARPSWMQDAMRRLAVGGPLVGQDIADVLALLKAQHRVPGARSLAPVPIAAEHLRPATGRRTRLLAIADPTDVNRIAPGQVLTFADRGVTLVYGDNGSGKTSFFRVLRNVCHGRVPRDRRGQERARRIRPDVFAEGQHHRVPQATVKFACDGQSPVEFTWRSGATHPEELGDVFVFDQFAVPLYIDEDCSLKFVPFGLDLFDDLAALCGHLDGALGAEVRDLEEQNVRLRPNVDRMTSAARFLDGLTGDTTEELIQSAVSWAADQSAELARLDALLDGGRQLGQLSDAGRSLDRVLAGCRALEQGASDAAVNGLRAQLADLGQAEALARQLAAQAFADSPVRGVGTEPWKALYEAARRFAEEVAHPNEPFPDGAESRCVLCQQSLDEAARERMLRFEALASEETQRSVVEARRRVASGIAALPRVESLPLLADELESALAAARMWLPGVMAEDMIEQVRSFRAAACDRIVEMGRAAATAASARLEFAPLPESPVAALSAVADGVLEAHRRAERMLNERVAAEAERVDLRARRCLSERVQDVRAMVSNRALIEGVAACRRDLGSRSITTEAKKLKEEHIGTALQSALQTELAALGLDHVRAHIHGHGAHGAMVTGVRLTDVRDPKVSPGDILSRGEQQILAIACFLAERRATGAVGAVVLDDPVSSLDRSRRDDVARRLVQLARDQQVIVLTHDIAFMHQVQTHAESEEVGCEARTLDQRPPHGAGFVTNDLPFKMKKLEKRLNELNSHDLVHLRKVYLQGGVEYQCIAAAMTSRLRSTWERAIEERVFNGVVTRYQPEIKTLSLGGVLLPEPIKARIKTAMSRLSARDVHDEASEVARPTPRPDEMEREILELQDFLALLKLMIDGTPLPAETPSAPSGGASSDPPASRSLVEEGAVRRTKREKPERASRVKEGPPAAATAVTSGTSNAGGPVSPSGKREPFRARTGLRLDGVSRNSRRAWDEAEVLRIVDAVVVLTGARTHLKPVSLEVYLGRRTPSGALPHACVINASKPGQVMFVPSDEDLNTLLERRGRKPSKTSLHVIQLPNRSRVEHVLRDLDALEVDLVHCLGSTAPIDVGHGELFEGATARWVLHLDDRKVLVTELAELPQLTRDWTPVPRVPEPTTPSSRVRAGADR